MKPVLVYITSKNKTEAAELAQQLLQNRLVACVNLFVGCESMYWWQGKIEKSEEVILVAKTLSHYEQSICDWVKKVHSYSCPCIVFLPIEGGNPDFLNWIQKEVTPLERETL